MLSKQQPKVSNLWMIHRYIHIITGWIQRFFRSVNEVFSSWPGSAIKEICANSWDLSSFPMCPMIEGKNKLQTTCLRFLCSFGFLVLVHRSKEILFSNSCLSYNISFWCTHGNILLCSSFIDYFAIWILLPITIGNKKHCIKASYENHAKEMGPLVICKWVETLTRHKLL